MALTLDATPKGVNSNSYATRAEADAYFDGRMNAGAWTAATNAQKDLALVAATSRLEQEKYKEGRTTTEQRLQWPRAYVLTPDENFRSWYDPDVVPRPIKEACFELALAMLNAGTVDTLAETGLEGFDSVTVGPLSIDITKSFRGGQLPANVRRLLRGLTTTAGSGITLIRG